MFIAEERASIAVRRVREREVHRVRGCHRMEVPQRPALLKPGDVTEFPERGIEDVEAGDAKLIVREIGDQRERLAARAGEHRDQVGRPHSRG